MNANSLSVRRIKKCGDLGCGTGLASVPSRHGPGRAAPWVGGNKHWPVSDCRSEPEAGSICAGSLPFRQHLPRPAPTSIVPNPPWIWLVPVLGGLTL